MPPLPSLRMTVYLPIDLPGLKRFDDPVFSTGFYNSPLSLNLQE
jgi:hypothetical protein